MRDLPIFAGLTPAEFELIASVAQSKHFSGGEIIFKEGSPIREVILLLSGSADMSKMIFHGDEVNEIIMATVGAGALMVGH